MKNIPPHLKYTSEHEWVRVEGDVGIIGITDYAQESLGDITFIELPEIGASFGRGENFGVVESVKAASDLYMPLAGEIVEINTRLENSPETVNSDPYGEAWMVKIKIQDAEEAGALLSPEDYSLLL